MAQNELVTNCCNMQKDIWTFKNFITLRGYERQGQRNCNSLSSSGECCFARCEENDWNLCAVERLQVRSQQLSPNDTRHFATSVRKGGNGQVWQLQTIRKLKPCLGCQLSGLTGCSCFQSSRRLQDFHRNVLQLHRALVKSEYLLMGEDLGCVDKQGFHRPTATTCLGMAQPMGGSDSAAVPAKQQPSVLKGLAMSLDLCRISTLGVPVALLTALVAGARRLLALRSRVTMVRRG